MASIGTAADLELNVVFGEHESARPIRTFKGRPLHEFTNDAVNKFKDIIKEKIVHRSGFDSADERHRKYRELIKEPVSGQFYSFVVVQNSVSCNSAHACDCITSQTYFKLTADGVAITPEMWKDVFTLGAATRQVLELELTKRAQRIFKIEFAAPIPNTRATATTIPHPDVFLARSFAFKGSLRKAAQVHQHCTHGRQC